VSRQFNAMHCGFIDAVNSIILNKDFEMTNWFLYVDKHEYTCVMAYFIRYCKSKFTLKKLFSRVHEIFFLSFKFPIGYVLRIHIGEISAQKD
jgi:hypothetical protein